MTRPSYDICPGPFPERGHNKLDFIKPAIWSNGWIANGDCFLKQQINEITFKMFPQMPSVYFLIKLRSPNGSCDFVGLMIAGEKKYRLWGDKRMGAWERKLFQIIHPPWKVQKWFISGKMAFKLLLYVFSSFIFLCIFFLIYADLIPQRKV